jgi:phospholipid/cholesterol/gamma-HCH transport system substrate-binding protein
VRAGGKVPSQKELQWAQLRVGLTVIFASITLAVLIFLMSGTVGLFTRKLTLYTYVPDAGGLRSGAPVRLQNVDIGNVQDIQIVADRPASPVKITFKVAGGGLSFLKKDSVVLLSTAGVLGETFVNIDSTAARGAPVQNHDTLASKDVPDFQDVVRSSQSTLQNIDVLVRRADRIVSAIENAQGSVGQLIYDKALYDNLNKSVLQVQKILNDVNSGKGSIGQLIRSDDLYNRLNSSVDKLSKMVDNLNAGRGTMGKLLQDPTLYNNANQTISKANQLIDNINAGKGALGKLAHDPEFANKLQNIVDRLSDITDRLNQGQGTAGKLLHDTSMYDNTNRLLLESRELVKAIRENPKRYLTIHLKIF